jgi:hypothetical protein
VVASLASLVMIAQDVWVLALVGALIAGTLAGVCANADR